MILRPASIRRGMMVFILIALPVSFILQALSAAAHPLNNGYSDIIVEQDSVQYKLFIPEVSLPFLDENQDGRVAPDELADHRSSLESYLREGLSLENDASEMKMDLIGAEPDEKDGVPGVSMNLRFSSMEPVTSLTIYYNLLFDDIDPNHLNFVLITSGSEMDQYMFEESDRIYNFDIPQRVWDMFLRYVRLGVEHILHGYDHLLFLLSLLLVVSRWKDIFAVVTAFTASHSVTLLLAAAGWLPVQAYVVEAGIALSIGYIAAENPFIGRANRRWVAALLLGLIHGMGFAGALGETGLPKSHFLSSLLAFNLGVELGQLAVVLAVLPLLLWLRRFSWYYRYVVVGGSGCIFLIALYWLAGRLGIL